MARRKRTITQRDMRLMEVREDFLERHDQELRGVSLKKARNMRSLATGAIEARPGLAFKRASDVTSTGLVEFRPADGVKYGVALADDRIDVFNESGAIIHTVTSVPWFSAEGLYRLPVREQMIIGGGFGIYVLELRDGVWSFFEWSFADGTGGEIAQPYWSFNPETKIQPSGRTGSITVTADNPVFTPEHVGTRIRYSEREIEITGYTAPNAVTGTVINDLAPSFEFTMASTEGMREGDVLIGNDSGYRGIITEIVSTSKLRVVTLSNYDGPFSEVTAFFGELMSTPTTTEYLIRSGKTPISPQPTEIWDEQMLSDVHGWPRSASVAQERIVFVNFPKVPSAIAMSSARGLDDFAVGSDDDDAIVREIGDGAPRLLHVVNSGDILVFSDKGCYTIPIRNQNLLTPNTFSAFLFDDRGSSSIRPVRVNDGVVFVESNGENVSVALLDGNVQLRWRVQSLTDMHNQLIKTPVSLCGPAIESSAPEKYVFVVNSDGTLAALSYNMSLNEQTIGVAPWDTDGEFKSIAPIFNEYWALVDREIDGETVRYLETFQEDLRVDSARIVSTLGNEAESLTVNGSPLLVNGEELTVIGFDMEHLPGKDIWLYEGRYVQGPLTVNDDGSIDDLPAIIGTRQMGLNFVSEVEPWPVEVVESARASSFIARCIRFIVTVQDTDQFDIRCNNSTRTVGGYDFGDPLNQPPPGRTKSYQAPVFGRREYAELSVIKSKPAQFRILSMTQEVQV